MIINSSSSSIEYIDNAVKNVFEPKSRHGSVMLSKLNFEMFFTEFEEFNNFMECLVPKLVLALGR